MTTSDFSLIRGSFELDWEGNISLFLSLTGRLQSRGWVYFERREGGRERSEHGRIRTGIQFVLSSQLQSQIVLRGVQAVRLSPLLGNTTANLAFFISLSLYLRPRVTKPRRSIRAGNFGKRKKVMRFLKDLIFDPDPSILAPVLPSPTSSVYV